MQPFRYTLLHVWALLYGRLLFGEVPDPWTLAGSADRGRDRRSFTLHRESVSRRGARRSGWRGSLAA